MTGPAIRSRLHALRQEGRAARLGRDLLDSKREAILRELVERTRRSSAQRLTATEALEKARTALREAMVELGTRAADAAALAQPPIASVEWRSGTLVGVPIPRLQATLRPFTPHYGAAATSASLDRAGAGFAAALPALVVLAEEEEAVRNLQAGLSKTVRRLKALEQYVIPRLEREAHEVAAALEEEDRDESIRRRRWLASHEADLT
jgi:H(+)-transporting ATP synthase subunit D